MNEEQKSIFLNDAVYSTNPIPALVVQGLKGTCNKSDIINVGVGNLIGKGITIGPFAVMLTPLVLLGAAAYGLYKWFNK